MSPTDVIIYHNPDCGTSRNTLGMIRNAGIEPHIIEYLKCPPSRVMLKSLISRMGLAVRDVMRIKGTPYHELWLDDPKLTDDQLLDAMLAHPILINRPIVVTPLGVKLFPDPRKRCSTCFRCRNARHSEKKTESWWSIRHGKTPPRQPSLTIASAKIGNSRAIYRGQFAPFTAQPQPATVSPCLALGFGARRPETQLERLVGVEPRIAVRVIAVVQILLGDRARAAGAFGDVLAGHLDVDAAGIGALGRVHGEERFDLASGSRSNGRVL